MEKFAKFEVPSEVLGDFMQEVSSRNLTATMSGKNRRDEHILTVPYERDEEGDIDELNDYLDDLISDTNEEEEEQEDER